MKIFFQRELKENLDDNNVGGFVEAVNLAVDEDVSLEEAYGREAGHKTILHLALEEDDGEPYVEELLRVKIQGKLFIKVLYVWSI